MDQSSIFKRNTYSITGVDPEEDKSILIYPFDQYKIGVKLDSDGKFLGITGVTIAKSFLSTMQQMQKLRSTGYFDLSKKYPEDPE
jgi:hypothetical protein